MKKEISYKQIAREYPGERRKYLIYFTVTSIVLLCVLLGAYTLFLHA